jgi:hypothetical protein
MSQSDAHGYPVRERGEGSPCRRCGSTNSKVYKSRLIRALRMRWWECLLCCYRWRTDTIPK